MLVMYSMPRPLRSSTTARKAHRFFPRYLGWVQMGRRMLAKLNSSDARTGCIHRHAGAHTQILLATITTPSQPQPPNHNLPTLQIIQQFLRGLEEGTQALSERRELRNASKSLAGRFSGLTGGQLNWLRLLLVMRGRRRTSSHGVHLLGAEHYGVARPSNTSIMGYLEVARYAKWSYLSSKYQGSRRLRAGSCSDQGG